MGSGQSKEKANETISEIIQTLKEKINEDGIEEIKIVLVGCSGAGKSTLINSFLSAARNYNLNTAPTGNVTCLTKRAISYQVRFEDGTIFPTNFIDTRGIFETVASQSICKVIRGEHNILKMILDEDESNDEKPKESKVFDIVDPKTATMVLFVFSVQNVRDKLDDIEERTIDFDKIKKIKKAVTDSGIPTFSILTKIDTLDKNIKKNILHLQNQELAYLETVLGNFLGDRKIIPVWNITGIDCEIDVLQRCHILQVFKKIIFNSIEFKWQCQVMKRKCNSSEAI